MEGNGWRSDQGEPSAAEAAAGDWRSQLQHDTRQRIVNKIMDILKRHLPISVPEGLNELHKIAVRFEEKIYTAATSQSDYLRKFSLKMLSMEMKTQHALPINPSILNTTVLNQNATDPGLGQANISGVGQTFNLQNMPGILQNSPTQLQSSQQSLMQMPSGPQSGQSAIQQTQPTTMQSVAQPGFQQIQLNPIQQSPHQHLVHILQQPKMVTQQQQQTQQTPLALLQPQCQQSQHQSSPQQLISQTQSQPVRLQQQLAMQQHPNFLHQGLQAPSALLQSENAIEQQKHFIQAQRVLPDVSSSIEGLIDTFAASQVTQIEEKYTQHHVHHRNNLRRGERGGNPRQVHDEWPHRNEMSRMLLYRLQSCQNGMKKMKIFKMMLGRTLAILQISENDIQPHLKETLLQIILNVLASNKKKAAVFEATTATDAKRANEAALSRCSSSSSFGFFLFHLFLLYHIVLLHGLPLADASILSEHPNLSILVQIMEAGRA
ncbi:hypothetical protein COCNU_09G008980 [Cocos nucifera]|uniref:Mediator complex subunit 15 KIX domain-containing protein n=1 Tax=Cocos nucifera TaxID=13894 RepID=A0A8K0IM77_COCNU|nr:hypothetical protein COCNU_09G008980 [Cocos nucifera]